MADLQRLLEVAVGEEHDFLEAHQRRVQFYASLVSAILAASIAGSMKATLPMHFLLLLSGPILVLALSGIALGGTFRLYQRFLEAVVVRAKIEQALGLASERPAESNFYWPKEALLAPRHLKSRREFDTSEEFLAKHRHAGYHRSIRLLFWTFAAIAAAMAIVLSFAVFSTAAF